MIVSTRLTTGSPFPLLTLDSWLLIQVDFAKELPTAQLEAAEIVLAVRIVVGREVGEGTNALHDVGLLFRRHRGDALGDVDVPG